MLKSLMLKLHSVDPLSNQRCGPPATKQPLLQTVVCHAITEDAAADISGKAQVTL